MGTFVIWALREGVPAQEPVTYDTEGEVLAALRALDVPALALCDRAVVGASGVTREPARRAIAAALPMTTGQRRVGVRASGTVCPACGEASAPSRPQLAFELVPLCAVDRASAQRLRGGGSKLSPAAAVERVIEKRRAGRAA